MKSALVKFVIKPAAIAIAVGVIGFAPGRVAAGVDGATDEQVAAIRNCADENQNDVTEAERACLFTLVATPCQNTPQGQSNLGIADCFRLEQAIWDELLNDNYKRLRSGLNEKQSVALRDMQRAWLAARETTCAFYDVKTHGSIAIPLGAACLARETARRALLLRTLDAL
jgi:uncharacterized protein YecT (DUF1311 family)